MGVSDALRKIHRTRPRATDVVVVAAAPTSANDDLRDAVTRIRKRGVKVRWAVVDPSFGLEAPTGGEAVRTAIEIELGIGKRSAVQRLRDIGVRVVEARSLVARHPSRRLDDIVESASGTNTVGASPIAGPPVDTPPPPRVFGA